MGVIIRDGVIYSGGGNSADVDPGITLTQAEYDALPEEERLNGLYYITDGNSSIMATSIGFDNDISKLEADNIQDAIDELVNTRIAEIELSIAQLNTDKAEKNYVVAIFEQLKELIQTGEVGNAVAVLDQAILDLSVLG